MPYISLLFFFLLQLSYGDDLARFKAEIDTAESKSTRHLTPEQHQLYSNQLKKCKKFLFRHYREAPFKNLSRRFRKCRIRAETYSTLTKDSSRQSLCILSECQKSSGQEKCARPHSESGYRVSTCKRILAPIHCLKAKDAKSFVLWKYRNEKGKIRCANL